MSDDAGGLPEGEAENSATADESVSIAEQIASLDRRAEVISTPISTWLEDVEFETTEDIPIPERLVDQVIGQEDASIVIRKASEQRRHVMMIGDPGTGKSMLAKSMTELLPADEMEDIMTYPNEDDENEPRVRSVPAGRGSRIIKTQRDQLRAGREKQQRTLLIGTVAVKRFVQRLKPIRQR